MSASSFTDYIQDLLSRFAPIKFRRMFGCDGIFSNGVMVGFIDNKELYLKANKETAAFFKQAGSEPFTYPRKDKMIALSYWKVPADVLENHQQLETWFRLAVQAARRPALFSLKSQK